jgi:hypothetical protein
LEDFEPLDINQDLVRALPEVARSALGYQPTGDDARIARAVQQISDFYISRPTGKTPYELPGALAAYLLYYTLLNHVRCAAVFAEARDLGFFEGIDRFIDWGSGMGAAWLAVRHAAGDSFASSFAADRSPRALETQVALRQAMAWDGKPHELSADEKKMRAFLGNGPARRTMAVFSYSLTELESLPEWVMEQEAIAIIEPGTNQDGRRLLAIRDDLIAAGYKIWAPCTHQGACPLLVHSKTDWCHNRVDWTQPDFYQAIESHLPMKHRTLVYSYLLARKSSEPPAILRGLSRLTGDQMRQKGQTRQMVCRGSEREFLSWQHRHGEPPEFRRGELVRIPDGAQKKGADIRVMPTDVDMRSNLRVK